MFLEDLAPRKGKITVNCWDKSWHAYWGGMWDGLNIGQFFCELNASYIIGYFDKDLSSRRFSVNALADKAKSLILQQRREREIDQGEARDLFDEAEDVRQVNSIDHLAGAHFTFMRQLFGDEWWHLGNDSTELNPDWSYLEQIIFAVQQALRQDQQQEAT